NPVKLVIVHHGLTMLRMSLTHSPSLRLRSGCYPGKSLPRGPRLLLPNGLSVPQDDLDLPHLADVCQGVPPEDYQVGQFSHLQCPEMGVLAEETPPPPAWRR